MQQKKSGLSLTITTITLLGASVVPAHAAQSDWSGAGGSPDWFVPGNWIGGTPAAGIDANIDTTNPNSTEIGGPANATAQNLTVGVSGIGALSIQGGASLTNVFGVVGSFARSHGSVTVSGAASRASYTWATTGSIEVGALGTGSVVVQSGGILDTRGGSIGQSPGSSGSVTISGSGSTWKNGPANGFNVGLNVGSFGMGTMTITGGGTLLNTADTAKIGSAAGSQGTVTVTGAGSLWSNGAGVNVGGAGRGTLTIADGAVVSGAVAIANSAGSTGMLNIGSAAGTATAAPGTLTATSLSFGAGTGTLTFNHTSGGYAFAPAINGNGSVRAIAGTTILTSANAYSGATTIEGGTLQVGAGGTTGTLGIGAVMNNAALAFNRSNALLVTNVIGGSGSLTQAGSGVLTLAAANTYTGTTHIDNGTLSVASDVNLGAPGAGLAFSGGALQLTTSFSTGRAVTLGTTGTIDTAGNSATFSSVFNGPGGLIKQGAGTLILTGGNSSYAGTTTISAGTVQIGAGSSSGTIAGNIVNNGALVYGRIGVRSYDGVVSGTGTLTQAGGGVLNLSGLNTYTGLSTVNAGVLAVNGTVAGNAQVDTGATLRGIGTVAGQVSVADGGHLAPGNSPGTIGVGSLVLNPNSQIDYELGLPGQVGAGNDLTTVAGNLTLDGTLNLTNLGGMSSGVYRLFNYSGVLTDNGLAVAGALPVRFTSSDFLVDTVTPGQVNLIAQAGGYTLQFWDGVNTTSNNAVDGGTATWNTATTNWTSTAGTVNAPWQSGFAVFQGAAGTVTLGQDIAFQGMQFRTGGYTIEGGGFALAGEPETVIRVDPLVTATISAPIVDGASGPARLIGSGAGLLVLGGVNTYSGGTAINGGAVQVSADTNLGAPSGGLSLNNGTLITRASFDSARNVDLGIDGGTFAPEADTTLGLTGSISGPGMLTKLGTGTLVLTGTNSYAGDTSLANGVLAVASDANLGAPGGALLFGGGTLRLDVDMNPAATRAVTLNAPGGRIDTNGHNATFAQHIDGSGGLTKLGSGTLVLAGNNLYEGGTTISAGTLQVGNGGASGSIIGDVVNNGALLFSRSDALTYGGIISGSGTLTQSGPNALTLTGDSTYAGGTTITGGTLQIGNGGTTGSVGAGNIVNNGILAFNRSDTITVTGAISGAGSLQHNGTGSTVLAGTNTYAGATTVAMGTLKAGAANTFSAASAHTVAAGATLDTAGFNQRVAALDNGGTVSLLGATAGSTLTVTGAYVAHSVLRLGTVLGADASASDRLVLDGPGASASGNTTIQIVNLGGLGALTTGNGIEVVSGRNGATTTAQTTRSAFSLSSGHVDAGAYEYRLHAADAQGAGENWYLRSTALAPPSVVGPPMLVPTYRAEVPLLAALPAQLRQADLAMLGNLHRRMGDEAPAIQGLDSQAGAQASARRAWGRVVYTDLDIQQPGIAQAQTQGHVSGLQAGTDLWASGDWRAGVYVGYLDGRADVTGNARGITARVGNNDLQSRYLGAYATWMEASGLYVDSVLQGGSQRFTVRPDINPSVSGKGGSFTASVEVGKPFALDERWSLEPQAQIAWQHSSLDDMTLSGAQVRHDAADGWIGRLGVRLKGDLATGAGRLQPYARANLYRASIGEDVVTFFGPAGTFAIASANGYSEAEAAAGGTLALTPATSLYGEIGHLWSIGGAATVKSSVLASLGIKVRW